MCRMAADTQGSRPRQPPSRPHLGRRLAYKRSYGMNYFRRLLQPFSSARTHGSLGKSPAAMTQVNVISYDEMKKAATTEGVPVFDVRSMEEFSRGKILNAVNIPVDRFEEALKMNPEDFKNTFFVDKPKPKDDIIVHCQAGVRAARAAGIAMAQGYTNVKSYAGGYKEWSEKGGR